jgi:hypothetical protein
MREFRLKTEKSEAAAAKKKFNDKTKAEQKHKRKKGHWEFRTEEYEDFAHVFMQRFETIHGKTRAHVHPESIEDRSVTVGHVVAQAKATKETSVLQEIGVVRVEHGEATTRSASANQVQTRRCHEQSYQDYSSSQSASGPSHIEGER